MFTNTTSHPKEVIDCLRQVVHGVVYRVEVAPNDESNRKELSMTRKAIKAREKRRIQREAKDRELNPEKYEMEEEEEEKMDVKPLLEIPQMTQELFVNLEQSQIKPQTVPNFQETYTDILSRFQVITFQTDPNFTPQIEIDPNASNLSVAEKEMYFNGILENYQGMFDRVKSVTDDAAMLAQSESAAYVNAQEKILLMKKLMFDSENLKVLCREKMKSFEHGKELQAPYGVLELLQSEEYGSVEPSIPFVKRLPSIPPDPVIFEDPSRQNLPMVPPDFDVEGCEHLVASVLPSTFPKKLSFRALSCYSLIRTLSLRLHISPFTPCAFLRSFCLPFPTRLLGEIHVSILRYLFANIGLGKYYNRGNNGSVQLKARASDNMRLDLMARGGDNLSYMDALSWPLFFEDYAFITAERLIAEEEDDSSSEDEKPKKKRSLDVDLFPSDDDEKKPKRTKKRVKRGPSGRFESTPLPPPKPKVTTAVGKRRGRPPKSEETFRRTTVPLQKIINNVTLFQNHPHFNVIKTLRSGRQYHSLSVEQKLNVLEFLLDELIQIDLFISELNFRFNKTQKYPGIFGPLPTEEELNNLSNVDQCVVCGLEGELICCDTCTSSYHRKCIGLPLEGDLPPGKWVCLECKVIDPVKLGPLRGGSKPCLEWHSRMDLASVYKNPNFATAGIQGYDMYGRPIVKRNKEEEFLIVHGYLFTKNNSPPECMPPEELYELLQDMGPELCLKWPWSQIPFNSKAIWERSDATQDEYYGNYFLTPVSHNPTVYFNLYRQAPLPGFISMQTSAGYTFPQEDLFHTYATFFMPQDMKLDHGLDCKSYDPLYPFKDFLLRLEREMYQACLLHELWGINRDLVTDPWSTSVYKCKSLKSLAHYAVKLVDAIHSRAFHDEWNLPQGWKARDHSVVRNYEDMKMDWTAKEELRRRKWERTPIVKSVRLMIEEGCLGKRGRVDVRKRKNAKGVVHLPQNEEEVQAEAAVQQSVEDGRRRSGRVQSRNAVHIGIETLVSDVMPYLTTHDPEDTDTNSFQTRINLLEKLVSEPYEKEISWTECGRKLYPPEGRLSPSVMKYLARNAGSVYAPNVFYSDRHEVGQPAVCHIWRERTLSCVTIEELALQLRVIDSYLNRTAIATCESFARRVTISKESVLKLVKCIHRDPSTGLLEYYVVQRGKRRGCWFSEDNIDLSALIMDRAIRIEAQRTKFFNLISERRISHEMHDKADVAAESAQKTLIESEQLFREKAVTAKKAIELSETVAKDFQYARELLRQAKEKADEAKMAADAERADYEAQLRMEREEQRRAAEAEARERAKEEQEAMAKAKAAADAKAKAKALAKVKAEAAAKAEAAKAKAEADKRKKLLEDRRRKEALLEHHAREEEDQLLPSDKEGQDHLTAYDEIVHNHSLKTKQLLHESSFLGQATVPSDKMQFARQKTMAELKEVNNMLRSLGMKSYDDPKLISDLASAEQVGMSMFVKEIGTEGQEEDEEEEEEEEQEKKSYDTDRFQDDLNLDQDDSYERQKQFATRAQAAPGMDPDAVLKAMGQHAIQQHLLNNLNDPNAINFPAGYDSENIQAALQQNLFNSDQGNNLSQLYAGYNLGNQFQLPDQLNELQAQAALQGNILNPAYQYGRQLGGDFNLNAFDPNAQFLQQLDLSQQQMYAQLPPQQQQQLLQQMARQQQGSGNNRQFQF